MKEKNKLPSLEQIREKNKRNDLLLEGMEEKPVELPPDAIKEGRDFFKQVVEPTVKRVVKRQLPEDN